MAEIRPFRSLRYDTEKIALKNVVTQPYDKITPEMQRGYYERDPANFIRFELPMGETDPYIAAKAFLFKMRQSGAIRLEDRPAMYVYEQELGHKAGESLARRALIALGRLHDYSDGVVFRHEETLTGPKRDREQLLKTTRVQSGLLFMLYDDAQRPVEALQSMEKIVEDFVDDIGIRQRLCRITDPAVLGDLQERFRTLPLFIADGHHRYETALSLRRSREGRYAEDFAMMALVNMRSTGLKVLATHRTIFGIETERFTAGLRRLVSELHATTITRELEAAQEEDSARFVCVVATSDGGTWKIDIARAELQQRFPGRSCELDVEALHLILGEYFGITPADAAAQRHIRYHRYHTDALRDVASSAQAAFLIRPVNVEKIRERSLRGALMPQKSTDFYPKMNSGLTLYSWDESFAVPQGAAR